MTERAVLTALTELPVYAVARNKSAAEKRAYIGAADLIEHKIPARKRGAAVL